MNFFRRKYYQLFIKYLQKFSNDDEKFCKIQYQYKIGEKLNLKDPKKFTEKLQWLKLYKYKESYGHLADKYEVRKYVENKIGNSYLNTLYDVYDSPEEIILDSLPKQFVLKATHGSGDNIIVTDKIKLDWEKTKERLHKFLQKNQYARSRERVYKNIKPRLIAERYLTQPNSDYLFDYKFLCFNGKPQCIMFKKGSDFCYYDMDWKKFKPTRDFDFYLSEDFPQPKNFDKAAKLASILAENFYFLRVDFYLINDKIYFGELTFFHDAGIRDICVEGMNEKLGKLLKLPPTETSS